MEEQKLEELKPEEKPMSVAEVVSQVTAATGTLNLQACLEFELIRKDLLALFQRKDSKNTFLVMPTNVEEKGEGMTIQEMVDEINALFKGVNPDDAGLNSGEIEQSVTDVVDASSQPAQENNLTGAVNFDVKTIKVKLQQAFLFMNTGEPAEYALSIKIDASEVFPEGQSFFNVKELTLGIWNTDRQKVIDSMGLVSVEDCLKQLT